MTAQQIFKALQDVDGTAHAHVQAAKAGFLEWAMTLPKGANTCMEAQRALPFFSDFSHTAGAAKLFVGYLRDAWRPRAGAKRRGGAAGKRRVLH